MDILKYKELNKEIMSRLKELKDIGRKYNHSKLLYFAPEYFTVGASAIEFLEFSWNESERKEIDIKYFLKDGVELYEKEILIPYKIIEDSKKDSKKEKRRKEYEKLKQEFGG